VFHGDVEQLPWISWKLDACSDELRTRFNRLTPSVYRWLNPVTRVGRWQLARNGGSRSLGADGRCQSKQDDEEDIAVSLTTTRRQEMPTISSGHVRTGRRSQQLRFNVGNPRQCASVLIALRFSHLTKLIARDSKTNSNYYSLSIIARPRK
jgi:hypothetical protein